MTASEEEFLKELHSSIDQLSDLEKEMILSSWDSIVDKERLGMGIMIRIFTAHSEIKHLWTFSENLFTDEDIRADRKTQFHAKKIMLAFGKLIKAITSGETIISLGLDRVGKAHFKYGVKPADFRHFVESLFHTFVQIVPDVTPEMAAGWKKFVMLLIQQITSSMEMEIQESK